MARTTRAVETAVRRPSHLHSVAGWRTTTTLRDAGHESVPSLSVYCALTQVKDKLASRWAPSVWALSQLACGLLLAQAAAVQGVAPLPPSAEGAATSALWGLAAAAPLTLAHRRLRAVHGGAGVEGSVGLPL